MKINPKAIRFIIKLIAVLIALTAIIGVFQNKNHCIVLFLFAGIVWIITHLYSEDYDKNDFIPNPPIKSLNL